MLGNLLRPRQGSLLGRSSHLQIVGDDAADLKVLQAGISDGHVRYRIPVRSRGAPDPFLRAFRGAGMPLNLNGEIQIIGGVVEALPGGPRIVTKKLKNAFPIHHQIPVGADILTLSGSRVSRELA